MQAVLEDLIHVLGVLQVLGFSRPPDTSSQDPD